MGGVDANGYRTPDTNFVSTTLGVLDGGEPDEDYMTFIYGPNGVGGDDYNSVFTPSLSVDPNSQYYFWLQDGLALDGKMYIFALMMGQFFDIGGVTRITIPLDPCEPYGLDLANHIQVRSPFSPDNGLHDPFMFSAAIMSNTADACAPDPDGYVYIYGWEDSGQSKNLIASRVLPADFEDFNDWRYWDGAAWSSDINDCNSVVGDTAPELSVSPLPDGKYLLVFQEGTVEPYVAYRIGSSPVGPFGAMKRIFYTPEPDVWPANGVATYNAKAHPQLSQPGKLLISYNSGGTDNSIADIYMPRWLRMPLSIIDPNY